MTGYDLDPEDMILELDPFMVIIYWIHFHSLSFSHVHSIAIFVLITFNAQIYTVFLRVGLPSGWLVRLDGSEGSNGSDVSDGSAGSDGSDELDSHLETPANGQAVVFLTGLFNN